MSAGGIQTAAFSYRSSYLASVVTYSGGHLYYAGLDATDSVPKYPNNKFAALIFYGGPEDRYGLRFEDASRAYRDTLNERGHFAMLCNHGQGHTIPTGIGAFAWRFLRDHPYGVSSAYADGIPTEFKQFCRM